MQEVFIPRYMDMKTIPDFINSLFDNNGDPIHKNIKLVFNNFSFTEPCGVTVMGNAVEKLFSKKVGVYISYETLNQYSKKDGFQYLEDSGLFKKLNNGVRILDNAKSRQTSFELDMIPLEESISWIDFRFLPWLKTAISVDKSDSYSELKSSIGEIFNNIKDHSYENTGLIFAQYFPNRRLNGVQGYIDISISDFGVGIGNSMRNSEKHTEYKEFSDIMALDKAIMANITSQTTPGNGGRGLPHLIDIVVVDLGGELSIISNSAMIDVRNNSEETKAIAIDCYYPGTLISMKIPVENIKDNFIEDDEEEGFKWEEY